MTKLDPPVLNSIVPPIAERYIRQIQQAMDSTQTAVTDLTATVTNIPPVPTFAQIQKALQANGSNPLNLTALIGGTTVMAGVGIKTTSSSSATVVTNIGVTSLIAGTGISLSGSTGAVTITSTVSSGVTSLNSLTGALNITAGTAIGISASGTSVQITNTGVTSLVAGSGISLSGATGVVTITSTGSGGSGVSMLNGLTGALTISPITAGLGVTTSGASTIQLTDFASNIQAYGTSPHTALANEGTIVTTLSSGVFTVNLPQASTLRGKVYVIDNQNVGSGNTVIQAYSGDGIGVPSTPSFTLPHLDTITIQSDGVLTWQLLSSWNYGGGVTSINGTGLGAVTINSAGAGSGITVITTGATISIETDLVAGTGISLSAPGGNALQINNSGVTSLVAGSGISISGSTGAVTISLPITGPGAGTYTVGAKLTGGGNNGTITIDTEGRITAITQAS